MNGSIDPDGNLRHKGIRLIAGNCPRCGTVVAVVNSGEVWPLVKCGRCGWVGDTHQPLNKVRLEQMHIHDASEAGAALEALEER